MYSHSNYVVKFTVHCPRMEELEDRSHALQVKQEEVEDDDPTVVITEDLAINYCGAGGGAGGQSTRYGSEI